MELEGEKIAKLGVRIEKPVSIKWNPMYAVLSILSMVAIVLTIWLLIGEYQGEPPAAWLRSVVRTFTLAI